MHVYIYQTIRSLVNFMERKCNFLFGFNDPSFLYFTHFEPSQSLGGGRNREIPYQSN